MIRVESLAVLLTCHNRVEQTLKCLELLENQENITIDTLDVFLVDDGSTDNTAFRVAEKFPKVKIIQGDGSLFWNRGMHLAFNKAIVGNYKFYIWLNDDTFLYKNALNITFASYFGLPQAKRSSIMVGSTCDEKTKLTSYGGYSKIPGWNPFRYKLVEPSLNEVTECQTMCGNYVMIPDSIVKEIGIIDPEYRHRWGDVDYGLRATKAGGTLFVAPGHIGTCSFNQQSNSWENRSLPVKERIKIINSIKGLQKEDWRRFTQLHGGTFWFLFWLSPYIKIYLTSFLKNK